MIILAVTKTYALCVSTTSFREQVVSRSEDGKERLTPERVEVVNGSVPNVLTVAGLYALVKIYRIVYF